MATCKDCLFYEVCPLGLAIKGETGTCLKFKDKTRFVEVVRCGECAVPHNKWTGCPKMNGLIPPPNHFCSYGVAKMDGKGEGE